VKKELIRTNTNPTLATLLAGGLAGVANWIVAIPIDTLKSNLQVSTTPGNYPHGIRSVWKEMRLNREPVTSLFRGLTPALLRAFPSNAACFLGYETAMNFLVRDRAQ
jgi:solute carrier family 25 carnitine/acylcarnitine transporter 20/29